MELSVFCTDIGEIPPLVAPRAGGVQRRSAPLAALFALFALFLSAPYLRTAALGCSQLLCCSLLLSVARTASSSSSTSTNDDATARGLGGGVSTGTTRYSPASRGAVAPSPLRATASAASWRLDSPAGHTRRLGAQKEGWRIASPSAVAHTHTYASLSHKQHSPTRPAAAGGWEEGGASKGNEAASAGAANRACSTESIASCSPASLRHATHDAGER
jgi:hypothetical protein